MRAATLLLSLTAALASAQDSTAASTAVEPAATVVDTPPEAGLDLFQEETVQITDDVITDLVNNDEVAQFADLFAFANSTIGSEAERRRRVRRSLRCKTSPGDLLWPSQLTWRVFDLLLGGALEEIIPIASPCYPNSEYKNYNAEQCAKITNEWDVDTTQ
jgi:hypothetical protein